MSDLLAFPRPLPPLRRRHLLLSLCPAPRGFLRRGPPSNGDQTYELKRCIPAKIARMNVTSRRREVVDPVSGVPHRFPTALHLHPFALPHRRCLRSATANANTSTHTAHCGSRSERPSSTASVLHRSQIGRYPGLRQRPNVIDEVVIVVCVRPVADGGLRLARE